jgi:hypothetical protein
VPRPAKPSLMSDLELDPDLIATLRALEQHRVEFVLVGEVADAIHRHGGFVAGIAIVPGSYGRNVERLWYALDSIDAELGVGGRPDGREWRREDLRNIAPCSFTTTYADLDVDFQPAGCNGYRDLFEDADRHRLAADVCPHVASVEDLGRLSHGNPPAALPPAPKPLAGLPPELRDLAAAEIRASRTRTPR